LLRIHGSQLVTRPGGNRDRNILQRLLALLGRDDDFFQRLLRIYPRGHTDDNGQQNGRKVSATQGGVGIELLEHVIPPSQLS